MQTFTPAPHLRWGRKNPMLRTRAHQSGCVIHATPGSSDQSNRIRKGTKRRGFLCLITKLENGLTPSWIVVAPPGEAPSPSDAEVYLPEGSAATRGRALRGARPPTCRIYS